MNRIIATSGWSQVELCITSQRRYIKRFGVDLGGVVIDRNRYEALWLENPEQVPWVDGCLEALQRIREIGISVWAITRVSKPETLLGTQKWLQANKETLTKVGLSTDRIHMCLEREDKAGMAFSLRLQAFVDDRLEILETFPDEIMKMLFS